MCRISQKEVDSRPGWGALEVGNQSREERGGRRKGGKTGRRKRKSRKMRKKEEGGNDEDLSPLPPNTWEEHGAVPWE